MSLQAKKIQPKTNKAKTAKTKQPKRTKSSLPFLREEIEPWRQWSASLVWQPQSQYLTTKTVSHHQTVFRLTLLQAIRIRFGDPALALTGPTTRSYRRKTTQHFMWANAGRACFALYAFGRTAQRPVFFVMARSGAAVFPTSKLKNVRAALWPSDLNQQLHKLFVQQPCWRLTNVMIAIA